MQRPNRRGFLRASTAIAAGFCGLRSNVHGLFAEEANASGSATAQAEAGYGPLLTDPKGKLDLPQGFSYKIISTAGRTMDDGLEVPGAPDGMAAFAGPAGLTVLVRNHELTPENPGPWGKDRQLVGKVPPEKIYDPGAGKTPCSGGTTTIVYDTRHHQVVREFLSLAGTVRNCAGGIVSSKSWITCEETVDRVGKHVVGPSEYETEKDHGFNFEVPVTDKVGLADPIPLEDMGRFCHEAVAQDEVSGVIYQTEDREDGCFYRFLPHSPDQLQRGGKLQALVVAGHKRLDTRNHQRPEFSVGDELPVEWIDLDHVTAPDDDLRKRAFDAGAALFSRAEGIWYGCDGIYFACTDGGKARKGQIWRYTPSTHEGQAEEKTQPGQLELFIEPNDGELIENADNLCVAPWGDLIVCEDRWGEVVRLVGVTPRGECYSFAFSHMRTEFAGVTFSPNGSTMFVNSQGNGLTFAIQGPWHKRRPPRSE